MNDFFKKPTICLLIMKKILLSPLIIYLSFWYFLTDTTTIYMLELLSLYFVTSFHFSVYFYYLFHLEQCYDALKKKTQKTEQWLISCLCYTLMMLGSSLNRSHLTYDLEIKPFILWCYYHQCIGLQSLQNHPAYFVTMPKSDIL